MRKINTRQQLFSRRALIFTGAQVAALSTLVGRLYYLQFIKSDEYKTLAEGNRVKLLLVAPMRGMLLDRNGLPLARNRKNYRVMVEDTKIEEVDTALRGLAKIIKVSDERIRDILAVAKPSPFAPPLMVKEHLNWEELTKVEFHIPDLPGTFIDTGQTRHYPLSEKASHLIGYVGAVAEEDLDDQPLLRLPEFKIGKNGVEKMMEKEVRGSAGIRQVEVNVHGQPVRELHTQSSTPGKNIDLTIDNRLQIYASERLQEESGAVVVMDVRNGNILALVSMPAFDPNIFSMGIPHDYWRELNANIKNPLMNKAISGQYPPGSTFKMLTGMAGMEKGIITAQSRVSCPGHFMLGNHRFNCWKPEGHGAMNFHDAIQQSCDTFFYSVAQRTGMDAVAEMARRFGLGASFNLGLPAEKPGIVPDRAWKRKRYKQDWQGGDTINASIGQGYVLSTPLQLAVMTSRIANGGFAVVPRLVATEEEPKFASLGIAPDMLEVVQSGMDAVVNQPGGTAYGRRIAEPEYMMAGKTGTSQVKRITVRGRDQSTIPWEDRHHALFVGYAPVNNPRYAVSVLVEHGGGGSAAAAPIARDILLKAQQLDKEEVSDEERKAAFQI